MDVKLSSAEASMLYEALNILHHHAAEMLDGIMEVRDEDYERLLSDDEVLARDELLAKLEKLI